MLRLFADSLCSALLLSRQSSSRVCIFYSVYVCAVERVLQSNFFGYIFWGSSGLECVHFKTTARLWVNTFLSESEEKGEVEEERI